MAHPRMTHQDLFDQLAVADRDQLKLILEHGLQRLVELEASAVIGADPYERNAERATYRNGHRSRLLDTGMGRLDLQIPKLRTGTFFPALLEPRRRIDRVAPGTRAEPWPRRLHRHGFRARSLAQGIARVW